MAEKTVCSLCQTAGPKGAEWIVQVGNDKWHVHKPCGQRLVETAPEGTEMKLFPSPELRLVWKNQRREREVQAFWQQKFAEARVGRR